MEFVQIIIIYFDWNSYFIASRDCYDVIRKHGKQIVVMEPVKGGVLAQIPEDSEKQLRALEPEISPAGWAIRYPASKADVIAVLSGMSILAQVQDNPLFSGEMNYLANKMLSLGVTDIKKPFPAETVLFEGEDITAQVKEAWDFLVESIP